MTATELATKALSAAKSVLFGPVGWVMMGVSALALLWQEEDKTKAATDALAVSTADYTKKLKEQTEAQNKAALYKLEDALAAQRTELGKLSQELQKQQKIQENGITVWTDLGEEINVHTDNTKKVTIAQAAYDEKNKESNAARPLLTNSRRNRRRPTQWPTPRRKRPKSSGKPWKKPLPPLRQPARKWIKQRRAQKNTALLKAS